MGPTCGLGSREDRFYMVCIFACPLPTGLWSSLTIASTGCDRVLPIMCCHCHHFLQSVTPRSCNVYDICMTRDCLDPKVIFYNIGVQVIQVLTVYVFYHM